MPGKFTPFGVSHWRFTLGDAAEAGIFRSVSGQGGTAEYEKFPYVSDQGTPVFAWVPTFGHVNYQEPITLGRGLDPDMRLWDWMTKEGEPEQREGTIEFLDFTGQPVATFSLTGVYPSSYTSGDLDASSKGVLLETVGLAFETWERKPA